MASQAQEADAGHKLPADDESYKRAERAQWLRAAILGASDGLLSTTSLMLGVGAVKEDRWSMVLSGLAGALAGACSMAVGEFVSVSTQRDIENSVRQSRTEAPPLEGGEHDQPEIKLDFSHTITETNKVPPQSPLSCGRSPVMKVMADEAALPNPYKAAGASGFAFLCGSVVPLLAAVLVGEKLRRNVVIVVVASIGLALCGGVGAHIGGSSVKVSAVRVVLGGWMAMGVTYGLLKPFDRDDGKASASVSVRGD